jgi:hypothetical protein
MPPLDQENRDWSKGNCFYVTLEFMKDSESLRAMGSIPKDSCVNLVHGLLSASEKRIKHAWIEIDSNVCDHSNNQTIRASAEVYYRDNDAVPCRRFSRKEADALLSHLQDQEGSLPIRYWGNLSDEDVACAMEHYNEAFGVFASGVCFSDPSDPLNASNLQRHGEPGASRKDREFE